MSAVVDQAGQVVIPAEVREKLGLSAGSTVEFAFAEDGRAYLKKDRDVVERIDALHRLVGTVDLGMTTDEFMAEIRGDD